MSKRAFKKFTEAWAYKRLKLVDPDIFAQTYALDMFNEASRPGITTRMCVNAALALLRGKTIYMPHSHRTPTRGWDRPNLSKTTLLFALRLCPKRIHGTCKHPRREIYRLLETAEYSPNTAFAMSYSRGKYEPERFEDHAFTSLYDNLSKPNLQNLPRKK